jgi:hypothetical protein
MRFCQAGTIWWKKLDIRPAPHGAYLLEIWGPRFSWVFLVIPLYMALRLARANSVDTCLEIIAIEALRNATQFSYICFCLWVHFSKLIFPIRLPDASYPRTHKPFPHAEIARGPACFKFAEWISGNSFYEIFKVSVIRPQIPHLHQPQRRRSRPSRSSDKFAIVRPGRIVDLLDFISIERATLFTRPPASVSLHAEFLSTPRDRNLSRRDAGNLAGGASHRNPDPTAQALGGRRPHCSSSSASNDLTDLITDY